MQPIPDSAINDEEFEEDDCGDEEDGDDPDGVTDYAKLDRADYREGVPDQDEMVIMLSLALDMEADNEPVREK